MCYTLSFLSKIKPYGYFDRNTNGVKRQNLDTVPYLLYLGFPF